MGVVRLPDVTLLTIENRESSHALAKLALEDCIRHCDFGDVLILSTRNYRIPGARWVGVDPLENWQRLLWYQVPSLISTSHVLFVQWDSWIVDPGMWDDGLLDYDYVGAPWWDGPLAVGNGGFSLRSTSLMRYLASHVGNFPLIGGDDVLICREYGRRLQARGFRFPDVNTALDFSFECFRRSNTARHFGFHGFRNWPLVLAPDELCRRFSLTSKEHYGVRGEQLDYFMLNWETVGCSKGLPTA